MTTTDHSRDHRMVTELLKLAPPPATHLAPHDRARLERDLIAALHSDTPRPSQWRRHAPSALVVACIVAIAALLVTPFATGPQPAVDTSLPVRAEPAAVRALTTLSTTALASAGPEVSESQYVYVRSTVVSNDGALGGSIALGAPHEREIWLSQSTDADDRGLIREFGQDWPMYDNTWIVPAGPERPTYLWVDALSRDPDRVIAELAAQMPTDAPQSVDQYVFESIGYLISEGFVPPDVADVLYQAVTKIPGVEFVPQARDAIGRPGFAIARTDEIFAQTTEWIFEPGNPSPIGTRWYTAPLTDPGQRTLYGATAILERGVADALGEPPLQGGDSLPGLA